MKIHLDMIDYHGIFIVWSILTSISTALSRSPVVLLLGPRQCGKTTLARQLVPYDDLNYFDLEDPASLARLDEPMTALGPLEGLVVIDELGRSCSLCCAYWSTVRHTLAVPDPGQIFGPDASRVGIVGRSRGTHHDAGIQPIRGRSRPPAEALAARGISEVLSCRERGR